MGTVLYLVVLVVVVLALAIAIGMNLAPPLSKAASAVGATMDRQFGGDLWPKVVLDVGLLALVMLG